MCIHIMTTSLINTHLQEIYNELINISAGILRDTQRPRESLIELTTCLNKLRVLEDETPLIQGLYWACPTRFIQYLRDTNNLYVALVIPGAIADILGLDGIINIKYSFQSGFIARYIGAGPESTNAVDSNPRLQTLLYRIPDEKWKGRKSSLTCPSILSNKK